MASCQFSSVAEMVAATTTGLTVGVFVAICCAWVVTTVTAIAVEELQDWAARRRRGRLP